MTETDIRNFKAAFGFTPEACEVEVWPDVWAAYLTFNAMRIQWRIGINGPTGLDYTVLSHVIDFLGINSDKTTLFNDIRVMEAKALAIMYQKT
ncbi:MAG: DUF1799 domain-containing protein [Candidatus Phlomobacter fragariae]